MRREELRADPTTRRARRRTLIAAILQLVGGALLFWFALKLRQQIGPRQYRIGVPGMIMVVSSMIMLGTSLALLLRSPFRMPIGERLFRLVWLGPIGRAFVQRGGGRGVRERPEAQRTVPPPRSTDTRALADLESRVSELERWRRQSRQNS